MNDVSIEGKRGNSVIDIDTIPSILGKCSEKQMHALRSIEHEAIG